MAKRDFAGAVVHTKGNVITRASQRDLHWRARDKGTRLRLLVAVLLGVSLQAPITLAGLALASPVLTRYPYLTDATPTSVLVNFATDTKSSTATPVVTWGAAGGSCNTNTVNVNAGITITVGSATEYQYKGLISGLSPNTSYCYRINQSNSSPDLLGIDASPTFTTALSSGASNPYSFAVLGDFGAGTTDENKVLTQIAKSNASFIVTAGDNDYNGSQRDYGDLLQPNSNVFGPSYWKLVGPKLPTFPAHGNHGFTNNLAYLQNWPEDSVVTASGGTQQQSMYCGIPGIPSCGSGSNTYADTWYAFDWGVARYYVLEGAWGDTACSSGGPGPSYSCDAQAHFGSVPGCTPCGKELTWLKNDLAAHTSTPMKFAFWHYPLYSDNSGQPTDCYLNSQPAAACPSPPYTGAYNLEGLLANNNVDIVFNGHAHEYERNRPQTAGKPLVNYVTGGGGAPLTGGGCSSSYCANSSGTFHYLLVTVNGAHVTVTPIDELGNPFDVQNYDFPANSGAVVSGVSPCGGPAAGGTPVTITGTGFTGATSVQFGANAATGLSVINDTTIHATSPAGTAGTTVDVTVTTPSGTSAIAAADKYTYTDLHTAVSTQQYTLTGSDGTAWTTMDGTNLATTVTPAVNSTAILGGNVDLFTNTSGFNQDIGIFVSDNGGADTLVAWKESGGFAGTFSPNAAFVQSVYAMTATHSYVFKLKWKTNVSEAAGVIIYAGAGGGAPFSHTRLTAEVVPSCANPYTAVSTQQYTLTGSDGTAWTTIDGTNLATTVAPAVNSTAILGGNVDLFTNTSGFNQDIGIFVSDNGGADSLVAWKESGGFAGTFSPNAAFVQSVYAMTAGHSYVFKLKWKTNVSEAAGVIIYAAAGGGAPFSPTRITAAVLPTTANPYTAVSTQQYTLTGSDGTAWTTIDGTNLATTVAPAVNSTAILGGNVDLFTNTSGFNQDIGIFVSDNGGADSLVAWKESGGFAGTFSPNAAFVQSVYAMTAGHSYVFKLKWKTNVSEAAGVIIYAGAGGGAPFSHTRLTAEVS